ncbi:hypothetical protein HPB50_003495 [Hyalomma asiaticum]|uniref:Uncharacterized protein n=1 Tax=Hyalomma asiaticum TaxID=266040 RepID=A0ACB7SMI1_HYAAI|nr:hypothetical protein HPB50_003495 [Hyalomma asiaticum]
MQDRKFLTSPCCLTVVMALDFPFSQTATLQLWAPSSRTGTPPEPGRSRHNREAEEAVAQAKEPPGVPKYSCTSQKVSEGRKRKSRPRAALHRLCGGISRSKVRSNGRPWPRRKTNAVTGSSTVLSVPPEPNSCVTVEATQRYGILAIQC